MGGSERWMEVGITMDYSGKISKDGGSNDGQWKLNGWRDGRVIAMGN
jgi:hypothetical protein